MSVNPYVTATLILPRQRAGDARNVFHNSRMLFGHGQYSSRSK